jgi:hypothetical protein
LVVTAKQTREERSQKEKKINKKEKKETLFLYHLIPYNKPQCCWLVREVLHQLSLDSRGHLSLQR